MFENIILVGFMGTGKDSVGKILAQNTNMAFISTDQMIELVEQKTVAKIFEERGEDYFRKKEKWALNRIKGLKNVVVATGGGMVIPPENRRTLASLGTIVQLFAEPDVLKKRIIPESSRPLVKSKIDIERLYRQRKGIYDFARITIDTSTLPPDRIAHEIECRLNLKKLYTCNKKIEISVKTKTKDYPLVIGFDILGRLKIRQKRVVIITNPLVGALYLGEIIEHLKNQGKEVHYLVIPDGELHKNIDTVERICNFLLELNFQRQDFIVSLGGGVITDITGFVASILKRGCKIVHIPTTLLAQVDAAIGGKTGINTQSGKNMLGTFYQPELVICDIKKLLTLSDREFINGIAEVIKYSLIGSQRLFETLQAKRKGIMQRNLSMLYQIVRDCAFMKAAIISRDEDEEKGFRQILNFGHTIGHIIETTTNYRKYSHGEAVAMGMLEEIRLFGKEKAELAKVKSLLKDYSLPIGLPEGTKQADIARMLLQDKKMKGAKIRMPIFQRIGKVIIKEVLCRKFF